MPTMRYRTPRAFSASSKVRSAEVRTISNTGKTATESLRGRDLETSEGVVHVTRIDARIGGRDGVCLAPQGLAVKNPLTLRIREVFELRQTAAHKCERLTDVFLFEIRQFLDDLRRRHAVGHEVDDVGDRDAKVSAGDAPAANQTNA